MRDTFRKWELVQDSKWPFNIKIMSGDDVIVSQGRYAYSSKDRNLDDVISAAHFTFGAERDNAAIANKRQVDALRLAAAAPELLTQLEDMLSLVKRISPADYAECMPARAAIAKARGE